MSRMFFVLPLAGAMMTAGVAYAQVAPPAAQETPAPAAAGNTSADCIDTNETRSGTTEELAASMDDAKTSGSEGSGEVAAADGKSASETQPVKGADAGTAPGGAGSSGWTGGTGGSDIGTSQSKELPTSPQQDHPAVASGLDPISGETAVTGPQAPPPPLAEEKSATAQKPDC